MEKNIPISKLTEAITESKGDEGRNQYLLKRIQQSRVLTNSDITYLENILDFKIIRISDKPKLEVQRKIKQDKTVVLNPNLIKCSSCKEEIDLKERSSRYQNLWYHENCFKNNFKDIHDQKIINFKIEQNNLNSKKINKNDQTIPHRQTAKIKQDPVLYLLTGILFIFLFSVTYLLIGELSLVAMVLGGTLVIYQLIDSKKWSTKKYRTGRKIPAVFPIFLLILPFVLAGILAYEGYSAWESGYRSIILWGLTLVFWSTLLMIPLAVYSKYKEDQLPTTPNTPLISIIIPAYNEEKVIANTIESTIELDYPNKDIIVIANNGWNYESLSEFSQSEQSLFLEQSNTKLNEVFGETASVLIPPYDIFNSDTILAMKENGMDNLSSSVVNDPIPYDIDSQIQHYPGSAFTGIYNVEEKLTHGVNHQETFTQIQNSLINNGFAVVTLSPPEFAKVKDQSYLNEINDIQINELELSLERIQNEGLEIRPMVERIITHTEKPITIPVDENVSNCNGILIQSSNLNGCDFRHLIVQQVDLSHSNLIETNFAGLEIVNVSFANAIMSKSNLTNISMSGGSFENAKLDKINLSNSNLQEVNLRGADLSEGNLKNFENVNSDAKEANFVGADLSGAIFKGVGLAKTDFSNANLFESDLSGINLANAILKDVNFENAKLTGTSFLKAKLTGSILKGADLTNANLKEADLTNADLTGATLDNITLVNAILVGAQLPGADLQKMNLKDVNLSGADLSGATLNGADLTNVNFEGTNFSGADLSNTGLELKDLKNAITDDKTITSETGFFFFRELIAFFESLFK